MTCSSRAARLHFTYESEPKGSEFSLLNALEVLFLLLLFSLSACTLHQNTEKNLCMFPKEPPSSYPVCGLSEPGRPSANDWSLLWGLDGESPAPASSPCRRLGHSNVPTGCMPSSAGRLWAFEAFPNIYVSVNHEGCSLLAYLVPEPSAESSVPSSALTVLPFGLMHLPFFLLAPYLGSLFFLLPKCVPDIQNS